MFKTEQRKDKMIKLQIRYKMNGLFFAGWLAACVTLTAALPCEVVTAGRGQCYRYNCPSNYRPSPITNPQICSHSNVYPAVCCEPDRPYNNPYNQFYPFNNQNNQQTNVNNICGITKSRRILAGTRANTCAWPWQVSIRGNTQGTGYTNYDNSLPLCAGVLIDQRWVLTSAYCPLLAGYGNGVTDIAKNLLVVVGENNIDKLEVDPATRKQQEQVLTVNKYFVHPVFKYSSPSGYPELLNLNSAEVSSFNVALLQLSQDVAFNECRKPACLPESRSESRNFKSDCGRKNCYIAGWGVYDNTTFSSYLLQTQVNLFDSDVCDAIARAGGKDKRPDGTLCADPLSRGKAPCTGDNGGMLVCNEGGRWALRGIISKSFVECDDKEPITVVDVAHPQIRSWIDYIKGAHPTY